MNGQVVVRSVGKAYVERRLEEMAGEKIDFTAAAEKNIYAEGEAACDTIKYKMKHRFGV